MDNQLRELLTNYGDVAGIWFDGWWDKPPPTGASRDLYPDSQPPTCHPDRQQPPPEALRRRGFSNVEKDLPPGSETTAGFQRPTPRSVSFRSNPATRSANPGAITKRISSTRASKTWSTTSRRAAATMPIFCERRPHAERQIQPNSSSACACRRWMKANGESSTARDGGSAQAPLLGCNDAESRKIYVHVLDPEDASAAASGHPK